MKDREFLIWLHDRLHIIHGESETLAHMHKLRAIIKATNAITVTPSVLTSNTLKALLEDLKEGSIVTAMGHMNIGGEND